MTNNTEISTGICEACSSSLFSTLGCFWQGAGYGKVVSHVVIGLKTVKGTKQLKLDPTIYDSLQKEKVAVGDVIYVEANSGAVRRVGRCDAYATEFDLEAEEYVPLPKVGIYFSRQLCTAPGHL